MFDRGLELVRGEVVNTLGLRFICELWGGGVTIRGVVRVVLQQLLVESVVEDSLALLGEWTVTSNTDVLVSRVASNMGQPIEEVYRKHSTIYTYILL